MKVLILSSSDNQGGAARAANRLHKGLLTTGVYSQMLVQDKNTQDSDVVPITNTRIGESIAWSRVAIDNYPLKKYSQRKKSTFSLQWLPDKVSTTVKQLRPDIVNLHWVNAGFLRIESLSKISLPLAWTLHDMWPFTGGCHYDQNCERYVGACGQCPALSSKKDSDLSRWVWQRKYNTFQKANLTVVTPSQWLAQCARKSTLFMNRRVEVIPNGVDESVYKPIDKSLARNLLGLPSDIKIILFGALRATSDKRKGFHLLHPALLELTKAGRLDGVEIAVIGSPPPKNPPDFGLKTHYLGVFNDDISMATIYSAADVFVAPSLQENLANTVMEALACGLPCVAFRIGGMPDMINHCENGYLAKPFEVEDLAKGIFETLQDGERYQKLTFNSRQKVISNFTLDIQAKQYSKLFEDIQKAKVNS
ncbi:glycosyltransferase family 4 protein [Oscillatoria sp. CS-180]|uniref:glycosyltransferase family 4 protein n=1 Tax=Oscillatoria sp. CS-180 TaxID=3021720 RepID=UPI00232EF00E|nr:glycosyltransferase family 4 protein [Oscillatoria sp. CS-180]MDB9526429.1 glycosyltransferase family 4 protein [Oscillatoria sp. CS-180]